MPPIDCRCSFQGRCVALRRSKLQRRPGIDCHHSCGTKPAARPPPASCGSSRTLPAPPSLAQGSNRPLRFPQAPPLPRPDLRPHPPHRPCMRWRPRSRKPNSRGPSSRPGPSDSRIMRASALPRPAAPSSSRVSTSRWHGAESHRARTRPRRGTRGKRTQSPSPQPSGYHSPTAKPGNSTARERASIPGRTPAAARWRPSRRTKRLWGRRPAARGLHGTRCVPPARGRHCRHASSL
mmetsp:Transcript_50382/g.129951  ORF Transcript_50382/g.129951 Transcript_50382/m.129951 type:complete len:236 (+) Transcript_50382:979-1686(+)